PDEHRTCVYRVVQEALRNVVRHSGARNVSIFVAEEKGLLRLSIEDDGNGFTPFTEKGLGLLGMQERVSSLSGKMVILSQPGHGTTLKFELPLPGIQRIALENPLGPDAEGVATQEINPFRTA